MVTKFLVFSTFTLTNPTLSFYFKRYMPLFSRFLFGIQHIEILMNLYLPWPQKIPSISIWSIWVFCWVILCEMFSNMELADLLKYENCTVNNSHFLEIKHIIMARYALWLDLRKLSGLLNCILILCNFWGSILRRGFFIWMNFQDHMLACIYMFVLYFEQGW